MIDFRNGIVCSSLLALAVGCTPPAADAPSPPKSPVALPPADMPALPAVKSTAQSAPDDSPAESVVPPPPPAVRKDPKANEAKSAEPATGAKDAKDGSAASGIQLKAVNPDDYLAFLKTQKGKFVAVDAWATWCVPCVKSFPKFVELAEKTQSNRPNIVFVSVSGDEQENIDQARQFLEKNRARFTNFLITGELFDAQEKLGIEAFPQYTLLDGDGKVIAKEGKFEDFVARFEQLVK